MSTRRLKGWRGQALVEFAIGLPVLLLLFLGILDLGRGVYALNAVANSAREGTRTAIVNQTVTVIRARAAQQATALGIDASATGCTVGTPTSPSTPTGPSGVCVEFRTANLASPCSPLDLRCVSVTTVKYSFSALTPIVSRLIGPLSLTSTSKQSLEALCLEPATPACPVP